METRHHNNIYNPGTKTDKSWLLATKLQQICCSSDSLKPFTGVCRHIENAMATTTLLIVLAPSSHWSHHWNPLISIDEWDWSFISTGKLSATTLQFWHLEQRGKKTPHHTKNVLLQEHRGKPAISRWNKMCCKNWNPNGFTIQIAETTQKCKWLLQLDIESVLMTTRRWQQNITPIVPDADHKTQFQLPRPN